MPGQLDLFGAPCADAEERPAIGKGRAPARTEPNTTTLATILAPEPSLVASPPADPPAPSVAAALAAIAELIAEPARWCQGCAARDAHGRPTIPSADARLSAYGAFALLRFEGRIADVDALRLWLVLDGATPDGRRFARWHDDRRTTHAEVLALFKRARGEP